METKTEEHQGRHGTFRLDLCPTCGGVFFDKGEVARLTNDRELERLIVDYAGGASRIPCPRCDDAMAVRPAGGIVLDVCVNCSGIWMDRGELETAARTLAHPSGPAPGTGAHSKDLAVSALSSPIAREALLNSASREGFRPPG